MTAEELVFLTTIAARTAVILVALIVGVRIFGKRQLGGMNVYDLVLVLALANAVQNAMTKGSGHLGVGIASAGTLMLMGWIVSKVVARQPDVEARLVGSPTILVENGKLIRPNCRREGVTGEEVVAAAREYGLSRLDQVKLAVLERDGTVSIVPKE